MRQTIEALRENASVAEYYQAAFAKWAELLKGLDTIKIGDLAEKMGDAQRDFFEKRCGGRAMGQEIMSWTGIAYYFDTEEDGFGYDLEKARKIYDALQLSHVSIEVKIHAERAAITYDLFEDAEENDLDG